MSDSKLLTKEEILKITALAFPLKNVKLLNYSIKKRSDKALGFLGDHLTLVLNVLINNKQIEKKFFVKTYPSVALMQDDFLRQTGLFQREVDSYKILFEKMREVAGEVQAWCPKFYYTNDEVLVLEDLSSQGFDMAPEKLFLDLEHLKVALKGLAGLHAASIILEEKESKTLEEVHPDFSKELMYNLDNMTSPTNRWVLKGIKDLQTAVDFLDKYSEEEKKSIKEKLHPMIMNFYPLNHKSKRFRNIFTHGDVWRNNILFKYENGKPIECRLVDYQFSRYAPAAHDIMNLLHLTTKIDFRAKHEEHLLQHYYSHFKDNLKDLNPEEILPWEKFKESCKIYKLLAIEQALLSMHYVLGPADKQIENALKNSTREEYDKFVDEHRGEYMKKYFENKEYCDVVPKIFYELIDGYILNKTKV